MAPADGALLGSVPLSCLPVLREPVMLPRPLPQSRWVWLGVVLGPSLIDYWCDLGDPDGDTLSEHIRALFRTDTTTGRVAFTATLAVGSAWLHSHILKELA